MGVSFLQKSITIPVFRGGGPRSFADPRPGPSTARPTCPLPTSAATTLPDFLRHKSPEARISTPAVAEKLPHSPDESECDVKVLCTENRIRQLMPNQR